MGLQGILLFDVQCVACSGLKLPALLARKNEAWKLDKSDQLLFRNK